MPTENVKFHAVISPHGSVNFAAANFCLYVQALRKKEFKGETADDVVVRALLYAAHLRPSHRSGNVNSGIYFSDKITVHILSNLQFTHSLDFLLLPREATRSAVLPRQVVCPSVCPSVCNV